MPIPSTAPPTWATDATFTSGPELGNPTKVNPSSGAKAQGQVPGQPYRSQRVNWLWNAICVTLGEIYTYLQLTGTDELLYGNTRAISKRFRPGKGSLVTSPWGAGSPGLQTALWVQRGATNEAGRPLLFCRDSALDATAPTFEWMEDVEPLPQGVTVTEISCTVSGSGSGVTEMEVYRCDFDPTTGLPSTPVQLGTLQSSTSSSSLQKLTITGLSEVTSATRTYVLKLKANGLDGGEASPVRFAGYEIKWGTTRASGAF